MIGRTLVLRVDSDRIQLALPSSYLRTENFAFIETNREWEVCVV